MSQEAFQDHLDRLGCDLASWPPPARDAARALLATSLEARHALEGAETLARALTAPPVEAPAGLKDRIIDKALGKTR